MVSKELKKIISAILVCVMFIMTIPVMAFADEVTTDDRPLGVIIDANGNIVEVVMMPRTRFVDKVVTIPAQGSYTTVQYEPDSFFSMGFSFRDDNGNLVTTVNCRLKMSIYNSNAIGGTRYLVTSETYSTNEADNNGSTISLSAPSISSTRPYYNGVYQNVGYSSLDIRIKINSD